MPDAHLTDDVFCLVARMLDFQSLKSFSLCSGSLRRIAISTLFRTVRYDPTCSAGYLSAVASKGYAKVEALVLYVSEGWMEQASHPSASAFEDVETLHIVGSAQTSNRRATDIEIAQSHCEGILQRVHTLKLIRCGMLYRDVRDILKLSTLRSLTLEGCYSHRALPGSFPGHMEGSIAVNIGRHLTSGITDLTVLTVIAPLYTQTYLSEGIQPFVLLIHRVVPALRNVRCLTLKNDSRDCFALALRESLPNLETFGTDFAGLESICMMIHMQGTFAAPLQLLREGQVDLTVKYTLAELDALLEPGIFSDRLRTFRIIVRTMDGGSDSGAAMTSLRRKFPNTDFILCSKEP